jgi:hypothetical protein
MRSERILVTQQGDQATLPHYTRTDESQKTLPDSPVGRMLMWLRATRYDER